MNKNIPFSLPEEYINRIENGILIISISGIRVKFPDGINPKMLLEIIEAFCKVSGNTIVIGNDGRSSSPVITNFIESILNFYNKKVLNIGTAPTPTIKAACHFSKADAGIIITASHNPQEWNGIKFLKKNGYFYDKEDYVKLFRNINKKISLPDLIYYNTYKYEGIEKHIESILKQIPNLNEIKKKKYKVVIDPVNSSGMYALPILLKELNCEIIPLNCEPSKKFCRPPEPTPKALKQFSKILKKEKASVGFALDPDGDRLVCGSPFKGAINEEYTLGLAYLGKRLQLRKKSKFVINFSTSRILEKVSREDGHIVIRAPVGEVNVLNKMLELNAKFGGEGNGGVIDPSIPSKGRDSLTGIVYILSAMAHQNATTIEDLMNLMPELYMEKMKFAYNLNKKDDVLIKWFEILSKLYPSGDLEIEEINTEDGFFILYKNKSWIHLRASNTEPIIRIIFEANSKKELMYIKQYLEKFYKK
ncbi:MAG: phosphoglucosamine mutase [Leptospiraceae bacterium]|nr:MAG: phosphoglucosamine mutase [Leptospiraceae bacterium]